MPEDNDCHSLNDKQATKLTLGQILEVLTPHQIQVILGAKSHNGWFAIY
jgi:hypothetical protein